MKKCIVALLVIAVLCGCLAGFVSCKKDTRSDDVIYIKNLYFGKWNTDDAYTRFVEDKFGVSFQAGSYNFDDWIGEVKRDIVSQPDVFNANVSSYNFAETYIRWADKGRIKALPDEVFNENGRWGNLAKMLNRISDIGYMKFNGKLYGIPITRNASGASEPFSSFTYVYRKDVARQLLGDGFVKDDDVYTWDEFKQMLDAFSDYFPNGAMGDAKWGFPSILNFYKTSPHCFTVDERGEVVNNYFTSQYQAGLRLLVDQNWKKYYNPNQIGYAENAMKADYTTGDIGILYDNLSLENYAKLRSEMLDRSNLDEKTAILKVIGPDGNFALEEQEQWFSMSLIGGNVSENKLNKILDIMNWTLSEEGTMMATYGFKDTDYEIMNDEITLLNDGLWEKDYTGEITDSPNGVRYLRYMVTLGNDLLENAPFVQEKRDTKAAYEILKNWSADMAAAYANKGETKDESKPGLRVLSEDPKIKWLQTTNKLDLTAFLLDQANVAVKNYVFSAGYDFNQYESVMKSDSWDKVLKEINANWRNN